MMGRSLNVEQLSILISRHICGTTADPVEQESLGDPKGADREENLLKDLTCPRINLRAAMKQD